MVSVTKFGYFPTNITSLTALIQQLGFMPPSAAKNTPFYALMFAESISLSSSRLNRVMPSGTGTRKKEVKKIERKKKIVMLLCTHVRKREIENAGVNVGLG